MSLSYCTHRDIYTQDTDTYGHTYTQIQIDTNHPHRDTDKWHTDTHRHTQVAQGHTDTESRARFFSLASV